MVCLILIHSEDLGGTAYLHTARLVPCDRYPPLPLAQSRGDLRPDCATLAEDVCKVDVERDLGSLVQYLKVTEIWQFVRAVVHTPNSLIPEWQGAVYRAGVILCLALYAPCRYLVGIPEDPILGSLMAFGCEVSPQDALYVNTYGHTNNIRAPKTPLYCPR